MAEIETDEPGARQLRRAMIAAAIAIVLAIVVTIPEFAGPQHWVTRRMMLAEDLPVLLAVAALFVGLALAPAPRRREGGHCAAGAAPVSARSAMVAITGTGVAAAVMVAVVTHEIALDHPYSRDEAMAAFDTAVLASGRLIAPVAEQWRPFVPALQPEFRLEVPGNAAWVSTYLPGNAAIRAALGRLGGGPALTNAILLAVSFAFLVALARRFFPDRPDAWLVAAVLFATSSQVLFMAATPYAMATHLALNLAWLWLFTSRTTFGHAGAIATGFLATGLHQIVFHPLFVAPFLLQLLLQRRLVLLAVYVASYAAIGMFWIGYWQLLLTWSGVEAKAAQGAGLMFLVNRVVEMLGYFSFAGLETMVQNLMRFAAWQNPLLLPLVGVSVAPVLRRDARDDPWWPLLLGFVSTLAVMFILLPYQATGWGYRYVHGLIGGACLLAAFAWARIVPRAPPASLANATFPVRTTAVLTLAAFALVPLHAWQMRATHAPYAFALRAIEQSGSDAVFVDTTAIVYGNDLVRNAPDLSNRPLVFDFGALDEPRVRELCRRFGAIAVFTAADAARHGIDPQDDSRHPERTRLDRMWSAVSDLNCRAAMPAEAR